MVLQEDIDKLAGSRLFAGVTLSGLDAELAICHVVHFRPGEHVLEPGAQNRFLYILLEGEVNVYLAGKSLPEHVVFGQGDCVGEISLLDGQPVSALVVSASDSRLLAMPHDVLWQLVEHSHGVARNLLAILAGRMRNDNVVIARTRERQEEIEAAANIDALTGVHNRRWLMDMFPRALARASGASEPLCLLMLDIDHFKRFNDRHGHLVGDDVLRHVARQLQDGLRAQDLVARYGGEEFIVLLPDTRLEDAAVVVERVRRRIADGAGVSTAEGAVSVTISCGIAQQAHEESLERLIARADAALLRAKSAGRDRVELA